MNEDVKRAVREFILATYLPGETADNLLDDTPLQTSGILDSLGTMQVVTFLETQYHIELTLEDTSIERFDRIEDMAAIVARKQGERRESGDGLS
jgi:acyl carrier protein